MVEALLQPETLIIVASTLLFWAGSHLVGIGQIVDVNLLAVGVAFVGFAVFGAAGKLLDFAKGAIEEQMGGDGLSHIALLERHQSMPRNWCYRGHIISQSRTKAS